MSKSSAVLGSVLGIKPIIKMTDEGKLVNIGKVRGRKQSLEHLVDLTVKAAGKEKNDIFFVSHSDSIEDAQYVAKLMTERTGIKQSLIHYIGPVIGSHTGPGTICIFMLVESR